MKARSVRKRLDTQAFVKAIQWTGLTLVFALLAWTVAMVVWQAIRR